MQNKESVIINLNSLEDYQPLLQGQPQTCGMRSGRVYLKAGQECGVHSTKGHEEMLVFLSGNGEAQIGSKRLEVGQGKISYIPPHTEHNIVNNGTEALVYIYCVAPVCQE